MRAQRNQRLIGALLVGTLLLAACGSEDAADDVDTTSTTTGDEGAIPADFFAEAEAICASANVQIEEIFGQIFGEDELDPVAAQPLINEALDIHVAAFDEVRALDNFPDDPEIVGAFDAMDEAETAVRERVSTPEGVTALFESDDDDEISLAEQALGELGLVECSAQGEESGEESGAFEGAELTPDQRAAATELAVTGIEFSYEGVPEDLPAGPIVLVFTNAGSDEHEIGIAKIAEGVTAQEAIDAAIADPDDEFWVETFVGGAFALPEESAEFTDVLDPGLYGYACFIETDDGTTHASQGMIGTFTAT